MTSSPTPAVLPDARALERDQMMAAALRGEVLLDRYFHDAEAKAIYDTWKDNPEWVPWVERGNSHMQDRARGEAASKHALAVSSLATPPASDAAVPAGELERACEQSWDATHTVLWRHASEQRRAEWAVGIRAALAAAAPKVASDTGAITPEWCLRMAELEAGQEIGAGALDHPLRTKCELPPAGWVCTRTPGHDGPCAAVARDTGAGLREAAIRAALCLSGFAGEGICIEGFEDPADAWSRVAIAVGLPNGDDDDLRKALATPTDATDGATGGGEDLAQRLTKPAQGNTIAMLAYAAELGTQPGIARWLRSVDNVGEFDSIRLSIAITALALATTPGGDLLEQAARYREALRQIAETQRERFAFAASHVEWCQRIARDTLKPAGDGGEA